MTQVSAMVKYVPILPTTVNSHDIGGFCFAHSPRSSVQSDLRDRFSV